jgi:hypothetical protein
MKRSLTFIGCRLSAYRFSSLGSPMFPVRTTPDQDPITRNKDDNDSFLFKHGSKIATFTFAGLVALIYSYYKSGKNRSQVEDEAALEVIIEPYEIQELRHMNKLSLENYRKVVETCKSKFSTGECTYVEFIKIVSNELGNSFQIKNGYLLDRIVLSFVSKQPSLTDPINKTTYLLSVLLPVNFLLVCLNLTMVDDATVRIESLHKLLEIKQTPENDVKDLDENTNFNNGTFILI